MLEQHDSEEEQQSIETLIVMLRVVSIIALTSTICLTVASMRYMRVTNFLLVAIMVNVNCCSALSVQRYNDENEHRFLMIFFLQAALM